METLLLALFELFAWLTGGAVEPRAARAPLWARVTIALLAVVVALALTVAVIAAAAVGWGVVKGLGG